MKRAVTMGNFDGCHLGHQALFRTLKAVAEVNHLQPTVIWAAGHRATHLLRHQTTDTNILLVYLCYFASTTHQFQNKLQG